MLSPDLMIPSLHHLYVGQLHHTYITLAAVRVGHVALDAF